VDFEGPARYIDRALREAPAGDYVRRRHLDGALSRRTLLGSIVAYSRASPSNAGPVSFADEWRLFKSRYVTSDGRVVDSGNGGVSHSEGQGWGLLFAATAQDQAGFDLILGWTARTLRRPSDALHAWRYVPNDKPPVQDINNATDGDMFIAAALIQAGRSWGRPDYIQAATTLGRDILRLLVRRAGSFTVLLPAIKGFENPDSLIVNPSYFAFPMMREIAKIVPSQTWGDLQRDGMRLIDQGRFGRWSLPPDWLRIKKTDSGLSLAPGWPPRFSYDAIRVPLWWCWQKFPAGPAMRSLEQFWSASLPGVAPAWVDLKTNDVAPYPATPGMKAIIRLCQLSMSGAALAIAPTVSDSSDYYDAALTLLARIAEHGMGSP
jgi:endo-1,4-beta-D-glucanase Y